jgi:pyruvate,water dikinase
VLEPLALAAFGGAGTKARNVLRLRLLRMAVPTSRVLTYTAAERLAAGDPSARRELLSRVARHFDVTTGLAVRSSADVEDGDAVSYAGRFTSVLDVRGAHDLVDAVAQVVHSARPPVRMGVLVQQMVPPVVSGVAFTVDPATGLHDVVVEAVAGRGDRLVQDGVTPQRWVVRGTALVTGPEPALLDDDVVIDLADQARRTARRWGRPLDLEWVFDGHRVVWVQARPVTAVADVPLYSRRIARDVLPGEVLPLVLSVNAEVVNPAWVDVLTCLVGDVQVDPSRMARTFGQRAYFDMTAFRDVFAALGLPSDALERLMGLPGLEPGRGLRPGVTAVRHVPRATRQVVRWARIDPDAVIALLERAQADPDPALESLDDRQLLAALEHAIARARAVARLSIDVPLVHAAHEALLRRLVARRQGPHPLHLDLGRDDERADLDPSTAVQRLAEALGTAPADDLAAVRRSGAAALQRPGLAEARTALDTLTQRFGHLAERSNNLSLPTWAEQPDVPVRLALARLDQPPARRDPAALHRTDVLADAPAPTRVLLGRLCDRTADLRVLREQVSLGYGATYMRLRPIALAVGARIAAAGRLDQAEDVFMLSLDEVRHALRDGDDDLRPLVAQRRHEAAESADLELPDVVIGDGFVPTRATRGELVELRGAAASAGRHVGVLRVLTSLAEGERLRPGDVLAVETTDVTWTPLFDRAGAVVTEAGGLLCHAAIVAREHRLPCVVSASGCTRLPDGATVQVDGYAGTVRLLG